MHLSLHHPCRQACLPGILCKHHADLAPSGAPQVLHGWLSGSAHEPLRASLNTGSQQALTYLLDVVHHNVQQLLFCGLNVYFAKTLCLYICRKAVAVGMRRY